MIVIMLNGLIYFSWKEIKYYKPLVCEGLKWFLEQENSEDPCLNRDLLL